MPWDTAVTNTLAFPVTTPLGYTTAVTDTSAFPVTTTLGYTTTLVRWPALWSSGHGWTSSMLGVNAASGNSLFRYGSTRPYHADQIAQVRKDYEEFKRKRERRRAEEKARRLFVRVAGISAWRDFREHGYHEVVSPSGARYRLRPGLRVQVMKGHEGTEVDHDLCAHLPFGVPWWDTMVVQHLMLSASRESEEKFLKAANRHSARTLYPIPELDLKARVAA